eukprot:gene515-146_t
MYSRRDMPRPSLGTRLRSDTFWPQRSNSYEQMHPYRADEEPQRRGDEGDEICSNTQESEEQKILETQRKLDLDKRRISTPARNAPRQQQQQPIAVPKRKIFRTKSISPPASRHDSCSSPGSDSEPIPTTKRRRNVTTIVDSDDAVSSQENIEKETSSDKDKHVLPQFGSPSRSKSPSPVHEMSWREPNSAVHAPDEIVDQLHEEEKVEEEAVEYEKAKSEDSAFTFSREGSPVPSPESSEDEGGCVMPDEVCDVLLEEVLRFGEKKPKVERLKEYPEMDEEIESFLTSLEKVTMDNLNKSLKGDYKNYKDEMMEKGAEVVNTCTDLIGKLKTTVRTFNDDLRTIEETYKVGEVSGKIDERKVERKRKVRTAPQPESPPPPQKECKEEIISNEKKKKVHVEKPKPKQVVRQKAPMETSSEKKKRQRALMTPPEKDFQQERAIKKEKKSTLPKSKKQAIEQDVLARESLPQMASDSQFSQHLDDLFDPTFFNNPTVSVGGRKSQEVRPLRQSQVDLFFGESP